MSEETEEMSAGERGGEEMLGRRRRIDLDAVLQMPLEALMYYVLVGDRHWLKAEGLQ